VLDYSRDELVAVARKLGLTHAGLVGELVQGEGSALDHFAQRGIVEHDVGGTPWASPNACRRRAGVRTARCLTGAEAPERFAAAPWPATDARTRFGFTFAAMCTASSSRSTSGSAH